MIFGLLATFFIGILLSLLGGGGSILTVPLLVYYFHIPPQLATAYSLVLVGAASAVAAADYYRRGLAKLDTALFFSFPSFVMVFLTRRFIVPALPTVLWQSGGFVLTKNLLIMGVFAVLMLLAALSMLRKRETVDDIETARRRVPYWIIFLEGLLVGLLTGFVGVGGGFLIIPVLTAFLRLPMKLAVGTSLSIIAINSLIGFLGDLGTHRIDWPFLGEMLVFTLAGVGVGAVLSRRVPGGRLRPAFGYLTLAMGTWVLIREIWLH